MIAQAWDLNPEPATKKSIVTSVSLPASDSGSIEIERVSRASIAPSKASEFAFTSAALAAVPSTKVCGTCVSAAAVKLAKSKNIVRNPIISIAPQLRPLNIVAKDILSRLSVSRRVASITLKPHTATRPAGSASGVMPTVGADALLTPARFVAVTVQV